MKLDDAGERALCPFCGTVSYTKRMGMAGAPVVVVKSHPAVLLSLGLGLLALLVAAVALLSTRPAAPPAPSSAPAPVAARASAAEPPRPTPAPKLPREPVRAIASYAAARLVDSDGDGRRELLVRITRSAAGARSAHFALITRRTGVTIARRERCVRSSAAACA